MIKEKYPISSPVFQFLETIHIIFFDMATFTSEEERDQLYRQVIEEFIAACMEEKGVTASHSILHTSLDSSIRDSGRS